MIFYGSDRYRRIFFRSTGVLSFVLFLHPSYFFFFLPLRHPVILWSFIPSFERWHRWFLRVSWSSVRQQVIFFSLFQFHLWGTSFLVHWGCSSLIINQWFLSIFFISQRFLIASDEYNVRCQVFLVRFNPKFFWVHLYLFLPYRDFSSVYHDPALYFFSLVRARHLFFWSWLHTPRLCHFIAEFYLLIFFFRLLSFEVSCWSLLIEQVFFSFPHQFILWSFQATFD